MSWVKITRDAKQAQCTSTYSVKDGSSTKQAIYNYDLVASDPTSEDVTTVEGATDGTTTVPVSGVTYSLADGHSYTCTRVQPSILGPTSYRAQVTLEFTYTPTPPSAKSNVSIRISGQQYKQDCYYDKDNKAVVNSAQQTFDPSVSMLIYDERIEVSYTATSDQSASFTSIRGTVNNASISFNIKGISRTFATRQLLCEDIEQTDTLPLSTGDPTYKVTASFCARKDSDGWVDKILDQGLYQLDNDNQLIPILDASGKAISEPQWLNGSGKAVDEFGSGATATFITFKIQGESDFTSAFTGLS